MRSDYRTIACWEPQALDELVDIFDGPHATPKKIDDGPIFLGISSLKNGRLDLSDIAHVSEHDFTKWTRRVTPREGDVVFSYETRLGEAAQIQKDCVAVLAAGWACSGLSLRHSTQDFFSTPILARNFSN